MVVPLPYNFIEGHCPGYGCIERSNVPPQWNVDKKITFLLHEWPHTFTFASDNQCYIKSSIYIVKTG